jgi:hypothetical protein
MKTLTATLLAAQQASSQTSYVKIEAKNKLTCVVRLEWERLYDGSETEYLHGVTAAGDGSLIRARISLPGENSCLYYQRIINPGPLSDFGTWTYSGQPDCRAVALASCGAEVSIFWVNGSNELKRLKSADNGASWAAPELLGYSLSTDINGLTAAYKPNGDLAVFVAEMNFLTVRQCIGGVWQERVFWDNTTCYMNSAAVVYHTDWNLLATGQDVNGNYKVWSLTYGDGGAVPSGTWSPLRELATAPAGGDFEYGRIFFDRPDVDRAFYVEKYSGIQSYLRPFGTHAVPDSVFPDNLWREPTPLNLSTEYGLAIAHSGPYCWLSTANGVWRAGLAEAALDITGDVISVDLKIAPADGRLLVELRNDDCRYQSPGQGNLSLLEAGCQLECNLGYITALGNETTPGPVFWQDSWEHVSSGGKSSLILQGIDGWSLLKNWRARCQFRWNKEANEMSVKQILAFVFGRIGLKLEVKSQSTVVTGFYPDFTIHPDDRGDLIVWRLLSFVPDLVFIEGGKVYLVNPQSSDAAVYSYGEAHAVFQGKHHTGSWQPNQVRIEGYDEESGAAILTDLFSWEQMRGFADRVKQVADRNIVTIPAGQAMAAAYLRKAEIESNSGMIQSPVNCGQQLYDVIAVTDQRAGLSGAKRRVMGIQVSYQVERGIYQQKLLLGGV